MDQPYNIANFLMKLDESVANNVAIQTPQETITYAQLRHAVGCFALHMRSHGVTRSSCVAIDTNYAFLAFALPLAIALLGCRWVQATRNALQNEAIGITHLLHDGTKRLPYRRGLLKLDQNWFNYPTDIGPSASIQFDGYASPDDTWMIAQSSGSTGNAKLMSITYRIFSAMIGRRRKYYDSFFYDYPPIIKSLSNPLSRHVLVNSIFSLESQGTIVHGGDYQFWKSVQTNCVHGSPNQLKHINAEQIRKNENKIRMLRITGGIASQRLINLMFEYFSDVRLGYGSTEADMVCVRSVSRADNGSKGLGVPWNDVDLQFLNEHGNVTDPFIGGTVRIRTGTQVNGYIGDPEATAEAFRDGWFYPGDIGHLTEDGQLVITGRSTDILNLGGVKVNAVSIDEVIQAQSDVSDGICFAKPDELGVDELAAIVTLCEGADPDAVCETIGATCRKELGPAYVPKYIYVCDAVPRNERGKTARHLALEAVEGMEPEWVLPQPDA